MLVVWFRNVIPGTFFIFGKPTVYKQRNSVLFQWITSEVSFPVVYLQVVCYVVYWISKALWSQTGDLIPLLSDRRNHLHVWATFLSVLAARLLPVLFKKKNHTHKLVCVGLQFINGCRKANSGCTWSNKLFIYVANRWLLYATVCFCILDGMAWNILSAGGLRFSITHMHTQEEVKWHL